MKKRSLKIEEVVREYGIQEKLILRSIERKWVVPAQSEGTGLDEEDLARIQLIHDLQELMGVNDEAVPIILHLLDQIHYLQCVFKKEMGDENK